LIEVKKVKEPEFLVTVEEENSKSEHTVYLDNEYYQKLTDGKTSKKELIKKSFEFLLDRESKESILAEFNLRIIRDYFPEYEEKIKT
jgi:hypothetical protein